MESKRDLAIILKSIPYEERHRIVTALTEQHGVVTAMARNSIQSRRFGGTLEIFVASEWSFVEKHDSEQLLRLDETVIRRSYEGLRGDFERLSIASVMNELLLKIVPKQQPCPDLFRLHANALAFLEEQALLPLQISVAGSARLDKPLTAREDGPAGSDRAYAPGALHGDSLALLNGYLAKLLQWSGSQPQLERCLGCEIPIEKVDLQHSLHCIVEDAGWICPDCRLSETRHVRDRQGQSFHHSSLRLTPSAIRDFQMSLHIPIRQIPALTGASRHEHRELFKFLEALAVFHLPGFDQKPLKSLRFLDLESLH